MPVSAEHEGDNVYRIEASGILLKSEMDAIQAATAQEIGRAGKVRLLLVLRNFAGWERGANWDDVKFYETSQENIERIAIVGEEKWRDQARMFVLADLRKSPVRYFLADEIDKARGWLSL
jgi:hypothetical protein